MKYLYEPKAYLTHIYIYELVAMAHLNEIFVVFKIL